MADEFQSRINELRMRLLTDLDEQDLGNMQIRVDALMKLAMMDSGHDHDTQGGVGHHDHTALSDLAWRIDPQRTTPPAAGSRGAARGE